MNKYFSQARILKYVYDWKSFLVLVFTSSPQSSVLTERLRVDLSQQLFFHIERLVAMKRIFRNDKEIVLASASPRRQDYLAEMGLFFRVVPPGIDEKCALDEMPGQYIERLATEKALCVAKKYPDFWIVAADTVVCLGDTLLEKPADRKDAVKMLMTLSGREHQVRTCICLHNRSQSVIKTCSVSTRVRFWEFSEDIAHSYVASGESMDKAGSYGIQGKGTFLVREIQGSYSNVVGLPLYEFIEMLTKCNLINK